MKRTCILILLLLAGAAPVAQLHAQPRLELRHLKPNTPDYYYYQLFIAAYCADSVIYDLQKHQLIYEETLGRIDTNSYTIDRPASPARNSCYDLVLVMDNSSSISADALSRSITAAHAYIDTMSRDCQRAAIASFADRPTLRSFLTADRQALHDALEGMAPGGKRALYDAIFQGMVELSTNGLQRVKVVLALTTGNDNASGNPADWLIETAHRDDIRVFIVGLGTGIFEEPLRELCTETGGLYFPVADAAALPERYTELAGFVQREFDEHRIVRRTRDVIMQNLRISMRLEACDDSVWVSRLFNPGVTSVPEALPPVSFRLGQSYPNPVHAGAQLHFHFDIAGARQLPLRLRIFDRLGREVARVFDRRFMPGSHQVAWSAAGLRPGVYFYRLSNGERIRTGTMTVIP